uniref:Uncharacterized protein n=1 Tax=Rhizophora mucronata TaxID=61149 RepID=A0A2P2QV86_RHIMU
MQIVVKHPFALYRKIAKILKDNFQQFSNTIGRAKRNMEILETIATLCVSFYSSCRI